jgi:tetratricopeptide (TPR) repeat protein
MYDFGLVLIRQKNRNGALIVFRLLQHYSPEYPSLVLAFGSAELGLSQIPAPTSPNAGAAELAGQAAIAVLNLRTADAERLYRQVILDYPALPFAHLCLALFLENLGRQAEAEDELKVEAKVNHVNPDAWIWLARLALVRRDSEQTRMYAAQALKLAPEDGICYLLSGKSYVVDRNWNAALVDLQKAETFSPDSYEVHYALVTVYSALDQPKEVASERKLFVQSYTLAHPPGLVSR